MDLLANVGALLADTQSLLTRLQDGDAADANDGDFFAADASTSPGRQASPSPVPAPSAVQPADEVASDEVYEFQVLTVTYCLSLRSRNFSVLWLVFQCHRSTAS